jgi:hypothetical protein
MIGYSLVKTDDQCNKALLEEQANSTKVGYANELHLD